MLQGKPKVRVTYSNFITLKDFQVGFSVRTVKQVMRLRSRLFGSWWQRVEPMMPWPWKIAAKVEKEIYCLSRCLTPSTKIISWLSVLPGSVSQDAIRCNMCLLFSCGLWIPLHPGCKSWAYMALETWCMKKDGWESVQVSTVPHESNESAVSAKFPTSAAFKNCFRSSKAGEDLEALPPKGRFKATNGSSSIPSIAFCIFSSSFSIASCIQITCMIYSKPILNNWDALHA